MQFTLQRETLLKSLQRVSGVVERRQASAPTHVNQAMLIVVKNQLLSLTTSNLEIEVTTRAPVKEASAIGTTSVPGKKFIDICKALPEGSAIAVSLNDNKVLIKSGRSRYVLSPLSADQFPQIPTNNSENEISVNQNVLRQLFELVGFAMAQQDVRYYLNGVLVTFNGDSISMVATDGHRLATLTLPNHSSLTIPLQVIIPRRAVLEMQRLFLEEEEAITVVVNKNHLRTITLHTSFTTKLIEGKFPDYQRVIPKNPKHILQVSRDLLRHALLRACALFSDKHKGVGLQFSKGLLRIIATTSDQDEVEDVIEVDYQDELVEIGMNASYLLEYLNTVKSDEIKISFSDASQAVLFESQLNWQQQMFTHSYVVMPMRL